MSDIIKAAQEAGFDWSCLGVRDRLSFADFYAIAYRQGMEAAKSEANNPGLLIDSEYASRLAFMLECLIVDYHGHWDAACKLLDEYKAAWEKINPSPPTFMGEPMPPERMERLLMMKANRKAADATHKEGA